MNFVLITGLLVVSVIVIANLKGISYSQTKDIEYEIALAYMDKIKNEIENSYVFPNDVKKIVTYEGIDQYKFFIHDNIINIYFPKNDINITKTFLVSNFNVIGNEFDTSGNITILFKKRNLYVTNNPKCILEDDICDPGCIIEDLCDPQCYNEDSRDSCISVCTDINGDGLTDDRDEDDICDKDCYNNNRNGGIYDIDCVETNDGICDPDTHYNIDGYCDRDCIGQNGVCDPDCIDFDPDCHHLDNGICESDRNENCINQKIDCNCLKFEKTTCDLTNGDEYGCI